MNRKKFIPGVMCVIVSIILLIIASLFEFDFEGIFWGLSGALMSFGFTIIINQYHIQKTSKDSNYLERLKMVQIERQDERNQMIQQISGFQTARLMIYVYTIIIIVSSIGIMINPVWSVVRVILFVALGLLVIQLSVYTYLLNHNQKKM